MRIVVVRLHQVTNNSRLSELLSRDSRGLNRVHLEGELQEELLSDRIPVRPELALALVDLARRYLERDRLVRLGGEEQVLPALVGRLDVLLVRGHEAVARLHLFGDLRIVDLEEQALLLRLLVALFRHLLWIFMMTFW